MQITRAELFELTLPLLEPFVISGGTMTERRSLVVVLHAAAGHVGYGEAPPFQFPFYSEETLASARDMIERVLMPRVVGRDFEGPEAIDAALRGCSSVQLHTFFQLPLEEYPATDGSRTQRALHALIFDPQDGLIAVMLEREAAGTLARRGGELHFLDLLPDANRSS